MRRKDREVTNIEEQLSILNDCKVCRIAVQDAQGLYIVPLSFGYSYDEGRLTLYFHSAPSGRKIRAIEENGSVAFEMDCRHRLIEAENACGYGCTFGSIIGSGTASIVRDTKEKQKALSRLMKHQTGKDFVFDGRQADAVTVFRLDATDFSVKERR